MLVGNKMDLLEQLNTKPINPLDSITWKLLAQEKISNTQLSCKTYEGIELFWELLENNVRTILKRVNLGQNPFQPSHHQSDILPQIKPRSSIQTGSPSKVKTKG